MTHKLINTGSYLLVVSDEHLTDMPNNINVYSGRYRNVIRFAEVENSYINECFEILAHLPLNNSPILEGVDLLPPLEQEDDVEKLAEETYPYPNPLTIGLGVGVDMKRQHFKAGYNKAKEKYKYTEEQARQIWKAGQEYWKTSGDSITYEELTERLQSLSQPKLPVAFKCETNVLRERPTDMRNHIYDKTYEVPKTTTNSQGKTVWVGEYVYEN